MSNPQKTSRKVEQGSENASQDHSTMLGALVEVAVTLALILYLGWPLLRQAALSLLAALM